MKTTNLLAIAPLYVMLGFVGCDLHTNPPVGGSRSSGKDLVISEVFAISPEKYYAFSWVEIMNATGSPVVWSDSAVVAEGYAVGDGGTILKTSDNGAHWSSINSGTSVALHAIRFREPDTGYAVGDHGTILKSLNRGRTWTPLNSRTTVNLHSVTVTNPATASKYVWIAGDSGTILASSDRGRTWNQPDAGAGTTKNLWSIDTYSEFGELNTLFACGEGGAVVSSPLFEWTQSPNTNPAYSFYSIASLKDTVWVVGSRGSVFHSVDNGLSWFFDSTHVQATLRNIFVSKPGYGPEFAPSLVWAVGDNGVIIKSTDNGRSWEQQSSPTTNRLNSVVFVNSDSGWAFGDLGTVLVTINGGESWSLQNSGTTANLYGGYFYPAIILPKLYDQYLLLLYAQRRHVSYNPVLLYDPPINPNFDFVTSVDTGYVVYNPSVVYAFTGKNVIHQPAPNALNPGAFMVIISDSGKFKDHFGLGPAGGTQQENVSTGLYLDPNFGYRFVLWSLLSSGEIRLVKQFYTKRPDEHGFYQIDTTSMYANDIDVVRYGGFQNSDANIQQLSTLVWVSFSPIPLHNPYPGNRYFQNTSAGTISEWWSMARHAADLNVDPNTENSALSFYFTDTPIPGWPSQR